MAPTTPSLVFDRDFTPEIGVPVEIAPGIARLTAPNASAYTFTGTNAFIIGTDSVFLVDVGPDDPDHLEALAKAVDGRKVEAVLLTHTHKDHSALAHHAAERFDAPIWFGGPHRRSRPLRFLEIDPLDAACDWVLQPDRVIKDGDELAVGDMRVSVIATPGHCANHLAFGLPGTPYLLSGDHVMGWNSTLVAVPDGSMRDYLASLDTLLTLDFTTYLPAHGGTVDNGPDQARALKAHRGKRNAQILEIIGNSPKTPDALLKAIYPDIPADTVFAARLTLAAHIEYLVEIGAARTRFGFGGRKVGRA